MNNIKLTNLDKKILFELDKDGRANYSEIARALKTTPQVIKYHYERLIDYEIIKKFWAFIDYDRAGYSFFWGYWFKFSGLTKGKEGEMYKKFQKNKYIPIVMRCDGYADAMLGIIAKDVFHHNQILQDVFNEFGSYITMSDIVVGLGFIKFPRSYLINAENKKKIFHISGGSTETAKFNKTERQIMSLLQIDGRMEFTKMAKILNLSVGLIHKTYNKLVKNNVITKTTYTLNHQNIGLKLFRILFKIKQFEQKRVDDLYEFCLLHQNINNYVKVMGNWQLMLDIEIKNRDKLRELIRKMKNNFQDIIFQIEINEVYKIDKFTQMIIEYPNIANKK